MKIRNESKWIAYIFLISIVAYGIIISFFTSTVHVGVDEELYVSLARSFHYKGNFEYENQIMDYNCVLYSMIISIAYYFYSPQNILFIMRMIGVISMTSAIFPIYFLAKDILQDNKKAVLMSGFLMTMPYMFDCAYIMQEVLSYPLFMWTAFFLYCAFGRNNKENMFHVITSSIFSVLCVFTKTYMFFIPFVINANSLYDIARKENKRKYILNTVVYDIVYFCFFMGMYFCIFVINGFEKGSNHYASVFSNLFPISINTVIYGVIGCIIYAAFFAVNTGIFPIGTIICKWLGGDRTWLIRFLLVSIAFMIPEIVFMIFLAEEGTGTLPHKFYFRYFQIFVPLILILFIKYKENTGLGKAHGIQAGMIMSLCITTLYFFCMQGKTREGIIDGHLFLFIENISKYIVPYADIAIMLLLLAALVFVLWLFRKNETIQLMNKLVKVGIIGIVFFWIIETVQLPFYTNVIADGKTIQNDSIKIAQYLNQEKYEHIYYVCDAQNAGSGYIRNFYGYIIQSYETISEEDMLELFQMQPKESQIAFLAASEVEIDNNRLECISLDTERLILYVPAETALEE
ncbi:MAG: hypothetical protein NC313_04480 [Butyrivibrio sp.]|nr:hypothetical protein [Butyrivibrio sp.]